MGPRQNLEGQCHEMFCFRFFSWIIFPQGQENNIRVISNFFGTSRRYLHVKVHHWYQRHQRQILPPVPLVLLIPVANFFHLPTVWTTPVGAPWAANNSANFRTKSKRPLGIRRAWGKVIHKKTKVENLLALSLWGVAPACLQTYLYGRYKHTIWGGVGFCRFYKYVYFHSETADWENKFFTKCLRN